MYILHFYMKSNQVILYIHIGIYHDSIFTLTYIHFHSVYIYINTIHAEVKILFHLSLTLNQIVLHLYFLLFLKHIFQHMDYQ